MEKASGRMEGGKINSGRGQREGFVEQVARKLDLEGWVGFQQVDVRAGVGGGERSSRANMQSVFRPCRAEWGNWPSEHTVGDGRDVFKVT